MKRNKPCMWNIKHTNARIPYTQLSEVNPFLYGVEVAIIDLAHSCIHIHTIAVNFSLYKLAVRTGIKYHSNSYSPADTLPFELQIMALKVKYNRKNKSN